MHNPRVKQSSHSHVFHAVPLRVLQWKNSSFNANRLAFVQWAFVNSLKLFTKLPFILYAYKKTKKCRASKCHSHHIGTSLSTQGSPHYKLQWDSAENNCKMWKLLKYGSIKNKSLGTIQGIFPERRLKYVCNWLLKKSYSNACNLNANALLIRSVAFIYSMFP